MLRLCVVCVAEKLVCDACYVLEAFVMVCVREFTSCCGVADRWQARREGDRNMRAGLIPSRQLQEKRILAQRQEQTANGQS